MKNDVIKTEDSSLLGQFADVIAESKEVLNSDEVEAMRVVCKTTCNNYND